MVKEEGSLATLRALRSDGGIGSETRDMKHETFRRRTRVREVLEERRRRVNSIILDYPERREHWERRGERVG